MPHGRIPSVTGSRGALCLVLHCHIPYVRGTGPWPHGEVWLYEAMAETYVPLLLSLNHLASDGSIKLTFSLTPVLVEQLAAADVGAGFLEYLNQRTQAAEEDRQYFQRTGRLAMEGLAERKRSYYRAIRRGFEGGLDGDLVGGFRRLQDAGQIEIATSAATHGYLPLLGDASVRLQLRAAVHSHQRHFGAQPSAIWLPECAYRPAGVHDDGSPRPGLETFLESEALRLFFAETFMITGGPPEGVADLGREGVYETMDAIPSGQLSERQDEPRSTHRAYWVGGSRVAVLGRDRRTGSQVWSGAHGYPGDAHYQEFHKQHERSGLRYWRVTGSDVGLDGKQRYEPEKAAERVQAHADHFSSLVESELHQALVAGESSPVILAAYDAELFGHWWSEGVSWLESVLRTVGSRTDIDLLSASEYVDRNPPETSVTVPEGSWGVGGGHGVWNNEVNQRLWPKIHEAEAALLARASQGAGEPARQVLLDQAARELLLMEASDWPFLITSRQAPEFAVERFEQHRNRFQELIEASDAEAADPALARSIELADSVFPEIDHHWVNP
jgi:1,4-alpha-glucan branching enzyme